MMGELGVRTLVDHLEKRKVEPSHRHGRDDRHPENLTDPKIAALVNPPKEDNVSGASLSGGREEEVAGHRHPQGDDARVLEDASTPAPRRRPRSSGTSTLIWQGPQKEDDRLQQIQLVQSAIAARVDGIVLAPLDSKALVKPVEDAVAKGIPVVVIDSALESTKIVSYVATNNYNGGVLAARRLGEILKGEGKIILLRYAVGIGEHRGAREGIHRHDGQGVPQDQLPFRLRIRRSRHRTRAQQKSQSLVTRFRGKVDGIFCPNESSTFGMLRALEGAGMLAATMP